MQSGLAWRALRHRRGQALVLGLLSGIVAAACAWADGRLFGTYNADAPSWRLVRLSPPAQCTR